jgi:hypothetical protein
MDASRAQRRMQVAARIKELRAEQAAQSQSPAPAGDVAAAPAVTAEPATPEVVTGEVTAPEPEVAEEPGNGSAATTLADMLRSGGLFG